MTGKKETHVGLVESTLRCQKVKKKKKRVYLIYMSNTNEIINLFSNITDFNEVKKKKDQHVRTD